jgi:hypothetical protein
MMMCRFENAFLGLASDVPNLGLRVVYAACSYHFSGKCKYNLKKWFIFVEIFSSKLAKKRKHNKVSPDFQEKNKEELKRIYSKTVLFNSKERAVIEQYCKKYGIRNESAFIRDTVIRKIMQQLTGEDYPELF